MNTCTQTHSIRYTRKGTYAEGDRPVGEEISLDDVDEIRCTKAGLKITMLSGKEHTVIGNIKIIEQHL